MSVRKRKESNRSEYEQLKCAKPRRAAPLLRRTNAFDRCMEVTKRSRNYFKKAMRREDYYRNTMMLSGASMLLAEGYLTLEDIKDCREEVQAAIRLWARMDE